MLLNCAMENTLESPLDCKEIKPVHLKGNQSWVFIGRTDAKLKLKYFGQLMGRTDSLEKTLMLGKIEGRRRRGYSGWDGWMASPTRWIWVFASFGNWWRRTKSWHAAFHGVTRVGHDRVTELIMKPTLSEWCSQIHIQHNNGFYKLVDGDIMLRLLYRKQKFLNC